MKLKILIFLPLIMFAVLLHSQSEVTIDDIVKESCDCMSQFSSNDTDLEVRVQECIRRATEGNLDVLIDHFGINDVNDEKGYDIGIKLARIILNDCPVFLDHSVKMAERKGHSKEDQPQLIHEELWIRNASGEIVAYTEDGLAKVILRDSDGNIVPYYILRDFPHSEMLLDSEGHGIGSQLQVSFLEKQVFMPSKGGFEWIKEIVFIQPAL